MIVSMMTFVTVFIFVAVVLCDVHGFSPLDSECLSQHGVCQQDNLGCSGFYKPGLCDGPVNRRCCIPNSFPATDLHDSDCLYRHGVCQEDNQPCLGHYQRGLCGGPTTRRCCIPENAPDLFQIFFYDQELLGDQLKLVYGSEGNLSCIYRSSTHGRWKIRDLQVYYRDPLHSKNVQKNDAGLYSCLSEGYKRTITVEVLYPPENATIEGPDVVAIGENLELTCSADANPNPFYTWAEDGRTIGNGSTMSFNREGNVSFVCKAQNEMKPTFGDVVLSTITTVRKYVQFEGVRKQLPQEYNEQGNGGIIAAAILGWVIAVVVSILAVAKYVRERDVLTKLQTELERYRKKESSRPLLQNADPLKMSSDVNRSASQSAQKTQGTVQLSQVLVSDRVRVSTPPQQSSWSGASNQPQAHPTNGATHQSYLELDEPEKEEECNRTGTDNTYDVVGDRSSGLRYDDLNESTMDKGSQLPDDYLTPLS